MFIREYIDSGVNGIDRVYNTIYVFIKYTYKIVPGVLIRCMVAASGLD